MSRSAICVAVLLSAIAVLGLQLPSLAQQGKKGGDRLFTFDVAEGKGDSRASGQVNLSDDDTIRFTVGKNKFETSLSGTTKLRLGRNSQLELVTANGQLSKTVDFQSNGRAVIESKKPDGSLIYKISDTFNGAGKIEIFEGEKVKYTIEFRADGELTLNSAGQMTLGGSSSSAKRNEEPKTEKKKDDGDSRKSKK